MKKLLDNKTYKVLLPVITAVVSVCVIIPIVVLGFYSRPSMDDYDYLVQLKETINSGTNVIVAYLTVPFKTMVRYWKSWQGTFTNSFFLVFSPLMWNERFLSVTPLIHIVFIGCCLYYCIYVLNRIYIKASKIHVFAWVCALLAALIMWLPSTTEGLFWFCGAFSYTPWMVLVFVIPFMIIDGYYAEEKRFKRLIVLSSVFILLIAGSSQIIAFEQILILMLISGYLIIFKKRYYSLPGFGIAIAGFLLSVISPASKSRQQNYIMASPLDTVIATINKVRNDSGTQITFMWLIGFLLITPLALELVYKAKEHMPKRFPIIQILSELMIICGMWCVPYLPTQTFGAGRLENSVYVAFMILSWMNYVFVLGWLANKGYLDVEKICEAKTFPTVSAVIMIISLCFLFIGVQNGYESNSLRAYHELRNGTAKAFAEELDRRFEIIKSSDEELVLVDPITTRDSMLYFGDIYIYPDEWPNYTMGQFYGKKIGLTYDPYLTNE